MVSPPDADSGTVASSSPNRCEELDQPRLGPPPLALVLDRVDPAPEGEALAQRGRGRQLGLLLDQNDGEPVAPLELPVVELRLTGDDLEQRRLAGAVAADEADALALVHDETGAVEQRMEAERELGVLQGQQRHGKPAAGVGRPNAYCRRLASC